jgi:hypothetical protein
LNSLRSSVVMIVAAIVKLFFKQSRHKILTFLNDDFVLI